MPLINEDNREFYNFSIEIIGNYKILKTNTYKFDDDLDKHILVFSEYLVKYANELFGAVLFSSMELSEAIEYCNGIK